MDNQELKNPRQPETGHHPHPQTRGGKLAFLRFRRCCAWIVGLVYFISGLLKLIDPTGAGLVMEEYFRFLQMDFMIPAAKATGTAFAFLEILLGTALLTGILRKFMAICIMILHVFFTIITAILLIFNPVMDCGCFGEAVHLSHLETFIKNIILLALLLMAYVPFKRFGTTRKRKYLSFGIIMTMMAFFTFWSLTHLPVFDFTAFKPGTTLLAADTHVSADEIYESVFIYEKEGEEKEFSLDDLPDSTWTFVNTLTKIKKQEGAPVLSFHDDYGFFQDSLAAKGKVAIASVYKPTVSHRKWEKTEKMLDEAAMAGYKPLLLISDERSKDTMPEEMEKRLENIIYHSDFKTLITLNRSNGGLTCLEDGYISCKRTAKHYPTLEEFRKYGEMNPEILMMESTNGGRFLLQSLLLVCILLIIFV